MDISNAQVRQFLNNYFDGDELHDLCFDYFPRVQQEFTSSMAKSDQIRRLLAHCRNYSERERLIGALRESRPGPFQREFELAKPEPTPIQVTITPAKRNSRQIFISHAYEDARLAHRLVHDLQQRGWQVWIAPDSIQPGEKWVAAIDRGLAESGVFLLLISQDAVQSRWVKSETNIAIQWEHERKMRFIPLQLSSHFITNTPSFWQVYQFIPFTGRYKDNLAQLLARLEERSYKPQQSPKSIRQNLPNIQGYVPNYAWVVLVFVLIVGILWAYMSRRGDGDEVKETMQPIGVITQVETLVNVPTKQLAEATSTPNIPLASGSLRDTWRRPQDGMTMVFVPGNTFTMGSSKTEIDYAFGLCERYYDGCSRDWFERESPAHEVQVSWFWLDQYEVTNSQFALFLNEVGNQEEGGVTWLEDDSNNVLIEEVDGTFQPKEGLEDYPVIEVSWYGASAYCRWIGGQLPTEAQWEFAARGEVGNIFPWGNEFDETQLNYCDSNCEHEAWKDEIVDDGYARTAPVVSYESQSWVGAYDLAGNVWEWVADWYADYNSASENNPIGPHIGSFKVLRGGSWDGTPSDMRSTNRGLVPPFERFSKLGFRCVISPGN